MSAHRLAALAALSIAVSGLAVLPAVASTGGSTTFYVDNALDDCSDQTPDSAVTPYCTIQAAVDAASAGDTVVVSSGNYAPFTVSASGTAADPVTVRNVTAALPGGSADPEILTGNIKSPGITVSGASHVDISGFSVDAGAVAYPGVSVSGSSNITLDNIRVGRTADAADPVPAVEFGGDSSAVTLSRSEVFAYSGIPVQIQAGDTGDVITTDWIYSPAATGVSVYAGAGTDVTSNTITAACGQGILATGAATGSSIQNNIVTGLVDSSDPTTPGTAACTVPATSTAGIEVDAAAVPGTTLNYNVVYAASAADSAYDWSGAYYATATALYATTSQGGEDLNGNPGLIQNGGALPMPPDGSPEVDSANDAAPGELPTDLAYDDRADDPDVANTGTGPISETDRGAFELEGPISTFSDSASATQAPVGGLVSFTGSATASWGDTPMYLSFVFPDSEVLSSPTNTVDYAFAAAGTYQIPVEFKYGYNGLFSGLTDLYITIVLPSAFTSTLSLASAGGLSIYATAGGKDSWNVTTYTFTYGDGTTQTIPYPYGSHTYAKPGTYTVTVTETDAGGNTSTSTVTFKTLPDSTPVGPAQGLSNACTGTGGALTEVLGNSALNSAGDDTICYGAVSANPADGAVSASPADGATPAPTASTSPLIEASRTGPWSRPWSRWGRPGFPQPLP